VTDLSFTDKMIRISKLFMFPACPVYGIIAFLLLQSSQKGIVDYSFENQIVKLYFLLDEAKRDFEFKR
jgi:hypothetical protein